jgi:adenine deaminase
MKTSGVLRPKTNDEMLTLMNVALGKQEADLAIVNAKLANVYTGEIQNDMTVTVTGKWIAYVGQNPRGAIGAGTEVIDANGRTLIPGLIDGHTHLAWLFRPDEFIKHAAGGGTTTVVTETLEPLPVVGYDGLVDFLSSLQNQPIKILANAPSMVSISHTARGIASEDLEKLLDRDDIMGLGETYWQALLQQPEVYLPALEQTRRAGKVLEGHSAGAGDNKLSAYVSTGISSCHEPINAQQVLQGVRLGLHIMIRE